MSESSPKDVTLLLKQAGDGKAVTDELLPLVYDELRKLAGKHMARETPGQTIQPTALVHEAYLRLVGDAEMKWDGRRHFFAAAARSMRQILINRAQQKKTERHGGNHARQEFEDVVIGEEPPPGRLLALDSALKKLEAIDSRKAEIVMLRYFAGLNLDETAKSLNLSIATVKRDWLFARTWLHREMSNTDS